MYIRLTAAHANRVQTGALHTCVVHPGFTHWVLSSLEHTQSYNNTWWYEVNINTVLSVNIFFFFLRSSCSYLWSQSGTAWVQQSHHWPAEESLQLQAQNEPQQAPSSSGLVNLVWSPPLTLLPHLYILQLYSCSMEVASAPSHDPQGWLEKVWTMPFVGERGGVDLWEVERRESCILALLWAH